MGDQVAQLHACHGDVPGEIRLLKLRSHQERDRTVARAGPGARC